MRSKGDMNIRFKVKVSLSDRWRQAINSVVQTLNRVKAFRHKDPEVSPLVDQKTVLALDKELYGISNVSFEDISKRRRRRSHSTKSTQVKNKNNNSVLNSDRYGEKSNITNKNLAKETPEIISSIRGDLTEEVPTSDREGTLRTPSKNIGEDTLDIQNNCSEFKQEKKKNEEKISLETKNNNSEGTTIKMKCENTTLKMKSDVSKNKNLDLMSCIEDNIQKQEIKGNVKYNIPDSSGTNNYSRGEEQGNTRKRIDEQDIDEKEDNKTIAKMSETASGHKYSTLEEWKENCSDWKEDLPNTFNNALLREGLLEFSDISSGRPVLSIAYGFYNEELAATNSTPEDQIRIQTSLDDLAPEQRDQYLRVFSRQHPQEASVNGVPESIWLAWLEPSLPFLSNLSRVKRRRSNLSCKNKTMSRHDSCPSCHGDHQFHQFLPYRFWGNVQLQFANHTRGRFMAPTELQTGAYAQERHAMADRRQRPRFRYRPYPQVQPLRAHA